MASDVIEPHRVAIYAAPAIDDLWWDRGSEWLGRCAFRNCALPQPHVEGVHPYTFSNLTSEPRRYGWHATLKAPMRLLSDIRLETLRNALTDTCRGHRVIELADMQVTRLGGFLALCPKQPPEALQALADDCVRRLQPLAAPLSNQEMARRRQRSLTPEEDALMVTWGYPWVLHRFRFHFSLTGSLKHLAEQEVAAVERAARAQFEGLPPLRLPHVSIFIEPTAGEDFELYEQTELMP